MTNLENMTTDCHLLAEIVLKAPSSGNRLFWLKSEIAAYLSDPDVIEALSSQYSKDYAYAEVENPYLVAVLKDYDQEVS